eukprot:CAMPEP_0194147058 /NCGR_PEP_ID=MMETSP0152-20130528/22493_1 /TAXON_ID=1049557 /ORGANISM="Thalassiothrix antarctica, Strain L6-D1" /LENGTH=420 /DNA_ID=CAMNT_0038847737 /DNA_START=199 /DNA_END=1461 /DNA_ORIENTATION=-
MGLAAAGNDENQMENILRKKVAAFVLHLVERAMVKKFENAKNEMNLSRNKLDNSKTWTASELSEYWSMIRGEESEDYANYPLKTFQYTDNDLWNTDWEDNKQYWNELYVEVSESDMFKAIIISIKLYFVQTRAKTKDSFKENYGIVALARDNSDYPWVIFPGAQGIQLHYGAQGDYKSFALEGDDGMKQENRVHYNYFKEWVAVKKMVREFVATEKAIFTGHSKGGLQAAHAAYHMTTDKSGEWKITDVDKVLLFVFGAPNLGNRKVSEEIGKHVGKFYKAEWIRCRRVMTCGSLPKVSHSFTDIIGHERFKYHGNGGKIDWIQVGHDFFPRGISERQQFFTPTLESSNFEYQTVTGQAWTCDSSITSIFDIDRIYHKKVGATWWVPGPQYAMSNKEKWDYEFGQRSKSHGLSYYLSAVE